MITGYASQPGGNASTAAAWRCDVCTNRGARPGNSDPHDHRAWKQDHPTTGCGVKAPTHSHLVIGASKVDTHVTFRSSICPATSTVSYDSVVRGAAAGLPCRSADIQPPMISTNAGLHSVVCAVLWSHSMLNKAVYQYGETIRGMTKVRNEQIRVLARGCSIANL